MAIAAIDTQQGATITLSVDSAAYRIVTIPPLRRSIVPIRSTYLSTTVNHRFIAGELRTFETVTVLYQNSPALAQPTIGTTQTITITGPLASGAAVAESSAFSGFIISDDVMPGFTSETEGLQVKQMVIQVDGETGPTHVVSS